MDCVDLEDVLEHVIANVHEQLQHHLRSIQAQHAEHLVARQEQHVAHMTELAGRMSRDALHVMRPLSIPRTSSSTETDADDMRTSERSFGSVFTKQSGHLHVEADDVDRLGISRENSWNPEPGCVSEESGWKRTRRSSRGCSVVLMTGASDATVDSHLTEALSVDKPLSSDRSGRTNLLASYEIGTDVQALQAARGWAGTGTSPGARAKEERPSEERLRSFDQKVLVVSMTVVLVNTVFLGFETNTNFMLARRGEPRLEWTKWPNYCFLFLFVVELCVRCANRGMDLILAGDRYWNVFDVLLIVTACLQELSELTNYTFLRSLRIFRLIRVVRSFRVMHAVKSLRLMLASVTCSLESLTWGIVFLCFLIFLAALFIQSDVEQHVRSVGVETVNVDLLDFYGSVGDTMVTLFMTVSGGDDWRVFLKPLQDIRGHFYTVFFVVFVAVVVVGILNILTAIFVDSSKSIADVDRDFVIQQQMMQTNSSVNALRKIFEEADEGNTGQISWNQFESHLLKEEVIAYLGFMELEVIEARGLFQLLDVEEVGCVSIDEFVLGMMRLKGTAKGVDIVTLLYENKRIVTRLKAFMRFVEDNFNQLQESLGPGNVAKLTQYVEEEEQVCRSVSRKSVPIRPKSFVADRSSWSAPNMRESWGRFMGTAQEGTNTVESEEMDLPIDI